jgi:hypothetical protein
VLFPDLTDALGRPVVTDDEPPRPSSQVRPLEAAAVWAETGHLVSPAYAPQLEAVRQARGFVRTQLEAIGLEACADDAGLMVSELAANAVLHARTAFSIHLRPTLEGGVRVEVHDSSPLPPVLTASSTHAMSGRGLDLVATMATRWGSHPLPAPPGPGTAGRGGKLVWFEVEVAGPVAPLEANTEELLAIWSDLEEDAGTRPGAHLPGSPPRHAGIITSSLPALEPLYDVVIPDLPVAELRAAKEDMDDLLRELQLLLLATPATGTRLPPPSEASARGARADGELAMAARLDAAARGFEQARRQVREQVTGAAVRGERLVTVRLRLPASAREAALRYREAVEAAGDLSRAGQLLTLADGLDPHAPVRRHYLDEVVRQLPEAPG